jgi:hypothetical protein
VDLSNGKGEVLSAAAINPEYLKGAAAVAKVLGALSVQAFANRSDQASTFLFGEVPGAVLIIMPMRAENTVQASTAAIIGAKGLSSSIGALRAHLTRTVKQLENPALNSASREEVQKRATNLQTRIDDLLRMCQAALPAPAAKGVH